ncbi:MAG: hypothetical protein RLZZ627_1064 [Pseudomonadota bacterium]|jgi:hypothetical protein
MVGGQPDARGEATSSVEAVNVWQAVCVSAQNIRLTSSPLKVRAVDPIRIPVRRPTVSLT